MMFSKSVAATGIVTLLALAGNGCGLISSDIASFKFDLPERTYRFDTAQAGAKFPATTLPSRECSDSAGCCADAAMLFPGIDCSVVVCDTSKAPAPSTCALTATIETPQPQQMVNLKDEVQGLSKFSSQSVIDVTISKITYDITMNTLNVGLPAVELFVGAQDATTTTHASAKRFGTVPPTTAGATSTGGTVMIDLESQNAFKALARNFGTPFVFMARTVVVVPGGTPLPMGAVSLRIRGQLKANAL
ncbi:MAG: hypothetical protein H7X95_07260 [Deltaproteobacteria bacterium]|nr:hypothetical protein [Deltaproteobacteria bacterium]